MISKFLLATLIVCGSIDVDGQDNVYYELKDLRINSINVRAISEQPLFRYTNYTAQLYDSSGYLKRASYNLSSYDNYNMPVRYDSLSMLRRYYYNNLYSEFASEQTVKYLTNGGSYYNYQNEKSYGVLDKYGNPYVQFWGTNVIGYATIDSLVQIWNNVKYLDGQQSADRDRNTEYAKREEAPQNAKTVVRVKRDGGGADLLDAKGRPVRCYLLLNLLTDVQRFYLPTADDRLMAIRNDWLRYIDTISSFLSLDKIIDYHHFEEDIGRGVDVELRNIGYNGKRLSLKFSPDYKIKQALITMQPEWDDSEYFYKYATYQYIGDSLLRINSYELPFTSAHDYIQDLETGHLFENINEVKLKKMRGCRQATEQLKFEHGKLTAYEKKYLKGEEEISCVFAYNAVLGLLNNIDHNTIVHHKSGLKEHFILQVSYK